MNPNKKYKQDRRDKSEGHMAHLIRRRMLQKDHGDESKFNRNKLKNYEDLDE